MSNALLVCLFSLFSWFNGNFHTVLPGDLYRSGQLKPHKLEQVIREKKIRTVISLRGGTENDRWFRAERAVCDRMSVDLHALHFSATALPPAKELTELVQLFETVEHPILIHCRAGADRTGLATALYLHMYGGLSLDKAKNRGLNLRYGHFRFSAEPMHYFFKVYRRDDTELSLRDWILERYPSVYPMARKNPDREEERHPTAVVGLFPSY